MNGYVKLPRYFNCTCGRQNKIKQERKKHVPPELDAIGYSRCPDCDTQSIHFAGPEIAVKRFASEFAAYEAQQGQEPPISTSSQRL